MYIRSIFNVSNQAIISALIAFSIFALAATAAIVANLVTGIVISGYREIGIMKAVGFTPLQVVGVFVLQILAPAAVASLIGIPAGTILTSLCWQLAAPQALGLCLPADLLAGARSAGTGGRAAHRDRRGTAARVSRRPAQAGGGDRQRHSASRPERPLAPRPGIAGPAAAAHRPRPRRSGGAASCARS